MSRLVPKIYDASTNGYIAEAIKDTGNACRKVIDIKEQYSNESYPSVKKSVSRFSRRRDFKNGIRVFIKPKKCTGYKYGCLTVIFEKA